MDFLSLLATYLSDNQVIPPIVQADDEAWDREKTYLVDMPDRSDDPDNVVVLENYFTRHAPNVAKNVAVKYVQLLVRNVKQFEALYRAQKVYEFILKKSDVGDDDIIHYLDSITWAIFDCNQGPIKVKIDEKGRHIWSLSFVVKTNIY